jgi:hypothetical protein
MNAADDGVVSKQLPVIRSLECAYFVSVLIAFFVSVAAVTGIASPTMVYPVEEVLLFALPTDIVSLVVVLPILLISMWLALRSQLVGLLIWPGALLYVLYIYLIYLFSVPLNVLFLVYLLLVTLSAYTTIGLMISINIRSVHQALAGKVPVRTGGVILVVLVILFILVQIPVIFSTVTGQGSLDKHQLAPFIADFIVLAPTWLVGGILLWRREAFGYPTGAGLLLLGTILFAGLGFVLVFPAFYDGSPVDLVGVIMMLLMALICFIPLIQFIRGAARN